MEGIQSSVVSFTLLLAIFGPTGSFGNKRTCFCETAWRPTGSDGSSDTELFEITNPVYRRSLYLGCSSPREWCPRDCKQNALATIGGSRSSFTTEAGNNVCYRYGQDRPCPGISVVAKYVVSNCGSRGTLRLASNVCCAMPRFRCSCDLMASMGGRLYDPLPLTPYIGAYQGPYYDCNENIDLDCKNKCIDHYREKLRGGSISPDYDRRGSSEMCKVLETILPTTSRAQPFNMYSAQVTIRYRSGVGDPKTAELEELCCLAVSGTPPYIAVREC